VKAVHLQLQKTDGTWVTAVSHRPGDAPGTLSDNTPGGREIYFTTCDEDCARVLRSIGGMDHLTPDRVMRHVFMEGAKEVATLKIGESYERTIKPDRLPAVRVRWIFSEDGE
jgi:hypothetical protein